MILGMPRVVFGLLMAVSTLPMVIGVLAGAPAGAPVVVAMALSVVLIVAVRLLATASPLWCGLSPWLGYAGHAKQSGADPRARDSAERQIVVAVLRGLVAIVLAISLVPIFIGIMLGVILVTLYIGYAYDAPGGISIACALAISMVTALAFARAVGRATACLARKGLLPGAFR